MTSVGTDICDAQIHMEAKLPDRENKTKKYMNDDDDDDDNDNNNFEYWENKLYFQE